MGNSQQFLNSLITLTLICLLLISYFVHHKIWLVTVNNSKIVQQLTAFGNFLKLENRNFQRTVMLSYCTFHSGWLNLCFDLQWRWICLYHSVSLWNWSSQIRWRCQSKKQNKKKHRQFITVEAGCYFTSLPS